MDSSNHTLKTTAFACVLALASVSPVLAADPPQVVFKNGATIPVAALSLQGANLVVTGAAEGYTDGQVIPFLTADHIYGERPVEINQGIALLLWDKQKDAIKLLEPVATAQKASAKIPGNFWLETAGALIVAHAINGNAQKVTDLGKEISEATPAPGVDPIVALGKALLTSSDAKERLNALQDMTDGTQPADISAYASFYAANMLMESKKIPEALESYLSVPCLFPSGGLILNAAAEIKAAGILTTLTRREEAVALLKSAQITSPGTVLAEEATKSLESLK